MEKIDIKSAHTYLESTIPPNYRLIPDLGFDNKWWSLRIATPFEYPDGEQMYVYVEVNDGKKNLVRMYDDEVLWEWMRHHNLSRILTKHKDRLEKKCLLPANCRFTLNKEAPLQVSMVRPLGSVWGSIPLYCGSITKLVEEVIALKSPIPLVEKVLSTLKRPQELAVAFA